MGHFYRAYKTFYVDRCLACPARKIGAIVGIGPSGGERGRQKAAQVRAQDCLCSLTVAPPNGEPDPRLIGAQLDYQFASKQLAEVLAAVSGTRQGR